MEKRKGAAVCAFIAVVCAVCAAENRTMDGSYNNLAHPEWCRAGAQLLRICEPEYADGYYEPAGKYRPSPRVISNVCVAQDYSIPSQLGYSDYMWAWGQILDHDLDLTLTAEPEEEFNIPVSPGDPQFDPYKEGGKMLALTRSQYDPTTGTGPGNPRQQINVLTGWIDGSMVYGSDPARAKWLRAGYKGLLKSQYHPLYGELLPYEDGTVPGGSPTPVKMFVAGDIRTNENAVLTCMHTILMREHNRLARLISEAYPTWSDEKIYQAARKIVGAEIQVVTYKEVLPALLGANDLPPYTGYKPDVHAGVFNEFSAAAFRLGHTLLSPVLLRLDEYGREIPYGHVPLGQAFMNPGLITEQGGIEPFLRGLAYQVAQEIDAYVVDDVRNILFGNQDLPSLNLQRGRDHGLPDFNTIREAFGLTKYTTFAEITSDVRVQSALESCYGNVDNIDPWLGFIAEQDAGRPGNTLRTLLREQFLRLRDGDRFWYQNDPELKDLLPWLETVRLSKIIEANTSIRNLQENVFYASSRPDCDQLTIWAAYVLKGYAPKCDTVMIYGNSLDATYANAQKCDAVKVWIRVDGDPKAVAYAAIPVKQGNYANGQFIWRGNDVSGICYFQCDLVKKTFYVLAKNVDMSKMKKKMAVDVQIDGYYGCGETTNYVVK
jgi:hypothetical protein